MGILIKQLKIKIGKEMKYYVIQFNDGNGWRNLSDTEYTNEEIKEGMPKSNASMKFRKKLIKECATATLSVKRLK